jgi:hypothetical protein
MRRRRVARVLALAMLPALLAACGAAPEYYADPARPTMTPEAEGQEEPAEMAFAAAAEADDAGVSDPDATPTPTPRLPGRPDPRTELILALVRLGLTRVEADCVADAVDVATLQPGDIPAIDALGDAAEACGMDTKRLAEIGRPG